MVIIRVTFEANPVSGGDDDDDDVIRVFSNIFGFILSNLLSVCFVSATENYSEQVEILRSTFHERFNHLRQIAQRFLKKSHKTIWKCDKIINNGM